MDPQQEQQQPEEEKKPQVRIVDAPVNNEIDALNLLVSFLGLAQKRGAFTIDEAAKIWECIKKFQKPAPVPQP
jgi:hypothetical protein